MVCTCVDEEQNQLAKQVHTVYQISYLHITLIKRIHTVYDCLRENLPSSHLLVFREIPLENSFKQVDILMVWLSIVVSMN